MIRERRTARRAIVRGALAAAGAAVGTWALGRSSARAQTTPSPPPASPVALPETPAARQLAWVLAKVNADPVELTDQEAEEHITAEFLRAVPPAQVLAVMRQLAAAAPITVEEYGDAGDGMNAGAILRLANGDRLQVSITVEPVAPFRIAGILFQPYVPEEAATPETLGSWEAFGERWRGLAPAANFLAAEVVAGEFRPVYAVDADRRLALGSTFKLYVLGELARQVAAGSAAWDQPLAIRDDWKSLPSWDMRLLPAGTERTLREFAEQMISVSDNTATDHLLFTLGREAVEGVQVEMGHGDPAVNMPFLSTRELFALKLAYPEAKVDAYLAAPVEERRRILAMEIAALEVDLGAAVDFTEPRRIDTVEWFASADEGCRAMAKLDEWAATPGLEPVAEILAINPGIPFDPEIWPYVGFKGGSEPGVLNLTWLLRRADGRTFVMTGGLNDPAAPVNEEAAVLLLESAASLLGQTA